LLFHYLGISRLPSKLRCVVPTGLARFFTLTPGLRPGLSYIPPLGG